MGVTLGGLDLGVAEDLLHLVQRTSPVDQEAGKAVAQVMDAHIGHARLRAVSQL